MKLSIKEVVSLSGSRSENPHRTFPEPDSNRYVGQYFKPYFKPKFKINFNTTQPIYTIGSCFAREIEDCLHDLGYNVPTKRYIAPEEVSLGGRPNFGLNQFNPGCMGQTIVSALSDEKIQPCVYRTKQGELIDLLLVGSPTVSANRIFQRHEEISKLYDGLKTAECLVLTLGLTECWYDTENNLWLNRAPPLDEQTLNSNRFQFRKLDYNECIQTLDTALSMLNDLGIKVVITVSPVPLLATFTNEDCVVANELSKSTLRAVAGYFTNKYEYVDYFPAYEMVRHLGISAYRDDNIHVRYELIKIITEFMINSYTK